MRATLFIKARIPGAIPGEVSESNKATDQDSKWGRTKGAEEGEEDH